MRGKNKHRKKEERRKRVGRAAERVETKQKGLTKWVERAPVKIMKGQ